MRKYLLILFLSLCAASNAQFAPTSAKTRFVNGTALGTRDSSAYAANDSLVVVINRQGRMMYRSTDGYWKILSNAAASDYVPYTGAVASVNLGEFRLSSRSVATDSILARSSAGGRIVSNSGTVISEYGAGGGSNMDFHGFAGYNANRSASYTSRSFTDKNYVDSADALDVQLAGTQTITGAKTFTDSTRLAAQPLGDSAINIGQIMAVNDYWKIYGTDSTNDYGELVFKVGDNGTPFREGGQRFRFTYDGSGVAIEPSKDVLIIDYDTITTNNIIRSRGVVASGFDATGLTGLTPDVAFRGRNTVAAGRWNLFMDGSANNHLNGRTLFGTTTDNGTDRIQVNGSSSFNGVMRTNGGLYIGSSTADATVTSLTVDRDITGSTVFQTIRTRGDVKSDVTSSAVGFATSLSTQAASFNLANLTHYRASQGAFGAGSSVTEQAGFFVNSNRIGAANNYAFWGIIPSGAGRWNLFMQGTASNYLEGTTLIGTTTNDGISKLIVNGIVNGNFRSNQNYRISGTTGGWDRRYGFFGSGGTDRGGFGVLGVTDAITKYYIGQSNTDNVAEFDATTKQTTLYGRLAGTSDAIFNSGGITAQRGNFTSLILNKDSVSRTTTNTQALMLDTASGSVNRMTLTSGTYTPTLTNATNISTSTAWGSQFMRVGNVVTVSGRIVLTPTATSTLSVLRMTLPIATTMTGSADLAGTMALGNAAIAGRVFGEIGTNTAEFTFTSPSSGGSQEVTFQFTYVIR